MGHLNFDRRDWQFLMHEQFDFAGLIDLEPFADFDMETFDAIVEEGVKFAVERLADLNPVGDRQGCRIEDGRVITPDGFVDAWKETRAQGWTAAAHSPEYGGMGLPYSISTVVFEAFNAACQAFEMFSGLTSGAGHLIETFGTEELKATWVERMYSGEFGGTMCLTEPQAGSAVGEASTSALEQDDGTFLVEGTKIFISAGDAEFYDNVVHLVLARIKGDPEGTKGLSLFAVPRDLLNDDGSVGDYNNVSVDSLEHKLGINGSPTCTLSFGADGPCVGYLVGERCSGLVHMFQMMNEARIACGLQGVAQANAAYQQTIAYARERIQGPDINDLKGPSVPIIEHPDVRRNLMFMKAYAEGTRALVAKAALAADYEMHATDPEQAERARNQIELMTPIVKAYSTDRAFKVTELAVQVFGGYGYCQEYPVEQYLRDTKISSIYEGTNGIQALDLLGRKMRMKGGALFMGYVMELSSFLNQLEGIEILLPVHGALGKAGSSLGEVAMWIAKAGQQDRALAMLQATPFLELFGDVMVGQLLADQARIAIEKLEELAGTATPTREQREGDREINFYAGKVDTARFFAAEVLTWAPSKAKAMTTGENAALQMVF